MVSEALAGGEMPQTTLPAADAQETSGEHQDEGATAAQVAEIKADCTGASKRGP